MVHDSGSVAPTMASLPTSEYRHRPSRGESDVTTARSTTTVETEQNSENESEFVTTSDTNSNDYLEVQPSESYDRFLRAIAEQEETKSDGEDREEENIGHERHFVIDQEMVKIVVIVLGVVVLMQIILMVVIWEAYNRRFRN